MKNLEDFEFVKVGDKLYVLVTDIMDYTYRLNEILREKL